MKTLTITNRYFTQPSELDTNEAMLVFEFDAHALSDKETKHTIHQACRAYHVHAPDKQDWLNTALGQIVAQDAWGQVALVQGDHVALFTAPNLNADPSIIEKVLCTPGELVELFGLLKLSGITKSVKRVLVDIDEGTESPGQPGQPEQTVRVATLRLSFQPGAVLDTQAAVKAGWGVLVGTVEYSVY